MVQLHQFRYSHYNEKVRWALEYKGIAHEPIYYLPGPHLPQIKRLSGQSGTPVICIDGEVISGSARIIAALEQRYRERRLYPADPVTCAEALAIEKQLDEEMAPCTRRMVYEGMLGTPPYIASMFSIGKEPWKRTIYARAIYLIKEGMRASAGVNAELVAEAHRKMPAFLDLIAGKTAATGYMVGDSFSIADLSAAALLTPVLDVRHPDVGKPYPMPARLAEIVAEVEKHPAAAWAHEMYRRHRGGGV